MNKKEKQPSCKTTVMIGSMAIEKQYGNILNRKPKDIDYLSIDKLKIPSADIIDGTGIMDQYCFKNDIATINEIYTLKVSHSFWVIKNGSWEKHIRDIKALQMNGAKLIPELYKIAYKEWEKRHGKKNINLNQDKTEFFNNNVKRIYDHDSIHEAVAFNDSPNFNRILEPGHTVKTSEKLFKKLPQRDKIQLVQEEVMVLSIERDLVPLHIKQPELNIGHYLIINSFQKQLKLLITQYSKGWFPLWIVENYYELHAPLFNYWACFNDSNKKILLP